MKIVHIYAKNLGIFEEALEGTGCRINGSKDLTYMRRSFSNFNARDTMGLIVFKSPMTKKTLKLIKTFDELFVFTPMPIIVISDQASELYSSGLLRVKNSMLFLVNSMDNTISDIDLQRIFTTLSCISDEMYDMSEIEHRQKREAPTPSHGGVPVALQAEEVLAAYAELGGRKGHANQRSEGKLVADEEGFEEGDGEGAESYQEIWRAFAGISGGTEGSETG